MSPTFNIAARVNYDNAESTDTCAFSLSVGAARQLNETDRAKFRL
jgi:hypothetical protein